MASNDQQPRRVMLYSHDAMGIGHLRRNMRIAQSLTAAAPTAALLVAGVSEARAFELPKNVDQLCVEHQLTVQQLADRAGLDELRVMAIVLGRWTPSPQERDAIAGVFGLVRDQIAWGHKTPIQHISGQGPG